MAWTDMEHDRFMSWSAQKRSIWFRWCGEQLYDPKSDTEAHFTSFETWLAIKRLTGKEPSNDPPKAEP